MHLRALAGESGRAAITATTAITSLEFPWGWATDPGYSAANKHTVFSHGDRPSGLSILVYTSSLLKKDCQTTPLQRGQFSTVWGPLLVPLVSAKLVGSVPEMSYWFLNSPEIYVCCCCCFLSSFSCPFAQTLPFPRGRPVHLVLSAVTPVQERHASSLPKAARQAGLTVTLPPPLDS